MRDGLNLRVDLAPQTRQRLIGYKAKRYAGVVDVDHVGGYDTAKFWDEIYDDENGRLILDPHEFYILASKEAVVVPSQFAAEMAPFDPMMGEFRVHYAGFFDPGFGVIDGKPKGAKAVLEVRSLDIPFILEDGQAIGRLLYERLADVPERPLRPGRSAPTTRRRVSSFPSISSEVAGSAGAHNRGPVVRKFAIFEAPCGAMHLGRVGRWHRRPRRAIGGSCASGAFDGRARTW